MARNLRLFLRGFILSSLSAYALDFAKMKCRKGGEEENRKKRHETNLCPLLFPSFPFLASLLKMCLVIFIPSSVYSHQLDFSPFGACTGASCFFSSFTLFESSLIATKLSSLVATPHGSTETSSLSPVCDVLLMW